MQINVVSGGSPALFNAMLFPEITPETRAWLGNQFERGQSMLTDMGRQFMDQASQWFGQLYDPHLMQRARALMRGTGQVMHPNTIVPLESIQALRSATPVMQRYVLAYPPLRELYHRQLCDGYSESYVDMDPGCIGEQDYTWRRVMNGVVQDTTDADGNVSWKVQMFPDDLRPGDRELEVDEQSTIINMVWPTIQEEIRKKMDVTSIFEGKLEI